MRLAVYPIDRKTELATMGLCPKTEGTRPQAERKPLRGIQHRPPGSGLVIRAVYLAGLPVGTSDFCLIESEQSEPTVKQP